MNIAHLMKDYFINESTKESKYPFTINNEKLPVKIKRSNWICDENSCARNYTFKNKTAKIKFSFECMKHIEDSDALIELSYKTDSVEVLIIGTSGYITEVEKDAQKELDYLYSEIRLNYVKES